MNAIRQFFGNAIRNYKTTATGCMMIAAAVIAAIRDPACLATLPPWLGLLGGLGLIFAPDSIKQITPALIVALLVGHAASVQAQVSALYTPEPMAVMKSLGVRDVGLWNVRLCNDGAQAVALPDERVYMAAPQISLITPARARAVILDRQGRTDRAKWVRYLKYGLIGATGLTGFGAIAASTEIVAGIAAGAALTSEVQRNLELEIPSTAPFLESLLDGPVPLAPAACATRTAFGAKIKSPKSVAAKIP